MMMRMLASFCACNAARSCSTSWDGAVLGVLETWGVSRSTCTLLPCDRERCRMAPSMAP